MNEQILNNNDYLRMSRMLPMTQLDSYDCRYDNNWIESNTSDDYLSMDSNTINNSNNNYQNNSNSSSSSSHVSPPPPYSLVI